MMHKSASGVVALFGMTEEKGSISRQGHRRAIEAASTSLMQLSAG